VTHSASDVVQPDLKFAVCLHVLDAATVLYFGINRLTLWPSCVILQVGAASTKSAARTPSAVRKSNLVPCKICAAIISNRAVVCELKSAGRSGSELAVIILVARVHRNGSSLRQYYT